MHEFGLNYISPLNYSIFLPSSSNSGTKRLFGHTFLSLLTGKEKRSYCSMKLAPTNSDVPTMKCTTLPMADTMGEYRSTSKDLRDRLMSQRPSPLLAVASKRGGMLIGTSAINYSPPSAIQICFSLSFLIAMCFCSCFPSGCVKM